MGKYIYSRQQSVEGQKNSRICINVLKALPGNTYKTNIEGKDILPIENVKLSDNVVFPHKISRISRMATIMHMCF